MTKLLREPVLHFAVLGILLFGYFALVRDDTQAEGPLDRIAVTEADLRQIVVQHNSVWRRDPTEEELMALAQNTIREEVLVREALALGLDRGDAAIRNRLRQKMQFLTDSAAQMIEPSDDILRDYIAANPEGFRIRATVAFDQVYLGETASPGDVQEALAQLQAGADPMVLSRGGLLPPSSPPVTRSRLDGAFGSGFFDAVTELSPGEWAGPVRSGYGLHLVRVTEFNAQSDAEFAASREKALGEWRREQAQALAQAQYDLLRERYDVQEPDEQTIRQVLSQ